MIVEFTCPEESDGWQAIYSMPVNTLLLRQGARGLYLRTSNGNVVWFDRVEPRVEAYKTSDFQGSGFKPAPKASFVLVKNS